MEIEVSAPQRLGQADLGGKQSESGDLSVGCFGGVGRRRETRGERGTPQDSQFLPFHRAERREKAAFIPRNRSRLLDHRQISRYKCVVDFAMKHA